MQTMPRLPAVQKFISSCGVRIYRISCRVFEELSARVYVLLGAGPPTLVDAGSGLGPSTRHILAGLESVRKDFGEAVAVADIRRIIVTHGHVDHFGGLPELLERTKAEVAIHPLDRAAIDSCDEYVTLLHRRLETFFQQAGVDVRHRRELVREAHFAQRRFDRVPVSMTLSGGQVLDGLRIIHTPGHAPGHVCILVGDVLLCADHILSRTIPQQWPESLAPYTGLGHYLESLRKVGRIPDIKLALGAHEAVMRDVYARIETIRAAHQRRLERLVELLRAEPRPLSIAELTRKMYAGAQGFQEVLALTDVGARVEYLHQRGRLAVANLGEVREQEQPDYRYDARD